MNQIVAGVANNLSISAARKPPFTPSTSTKTVDKILDSDDDDDDEVFIDANDEEDDANEVVRETMWDSKGYKSATTPKTAPTTVLPRNKDKANMDYASIVAANSALCAVPQKAFIDQLKKEQPKEGYHDDDDDHSDSDSGDEQVQKSGHGSDSAEDYTDDEDEGDDGYKPGGYHPVKVGEVYNQRYVVIKKLGWGHFSTVWMVKDRKVIATSESDSHKNKFYALKIQKSAEHYTEAAMDEVELLDCVASERKQCEASIGLDSIDPDGVTTREIVEHSKHVATLHDSFFHTGPNGRHMCMVFTMLGCNLLSVIKSFNYRGIPIPVVKKMIRGICMGLDFLHRKCSIIHTDLKPENVLLQFPTQMTIEEEAAGAQTATVEPDSDRIKRNQLSVSTSELETALKDPNLPPDERKKIKRRLKRKRQKERKRLQSKTGNDDDGTDTEEDDEEEDEDTEAGVASASFLSDMEMESIISGRFGSPKLLSPNGPDDDGVSEAHHRVLRRLKHSPFVICNFGRHEVAADSKLGRVLRNSVSVDQPTRDELEDHFDTHDENGSGVADVAFLVRAYTPEEEIADNLSVALGDIPWERSLGTGVTREWYVGKMPFLFSWS